MKLQLELGSIATPYEPYTESSAYTPAGEPLRSLPNGTKDEVSITEGKYTKKVSDTVSVSGTIFASLDTTTYVNVDVVKTTAFSSAAAGTTSKDGMTRLYDTNGIELTEVAQTDIDNTASIGKYYWHTDKTLWLIVAKGTYADITTARTALGTMTLTYQLTEEVESEIQVRFFDNGQHGTALRTFGRNTTVIKDTVVWKEEKPVEGVVTFDVDVTLTTLDVVRRNDGTPEEPVWVDVTDDSTLDAGTKTVTITDADPDKDYFISVYYDPSDTTNGTIVEKHPVDSVVTLPKNINASGNFSGVMV